jgi:PIN domain nuclease of toxin-antitoxin system
VDERRLSREQAKMLEATVRRTEPVAISSISLLEFSVLVSDGKLKLKRRLEELLNELQADPQFRLLPFTYEIASEIPALRVLRDPADRAIVATARVHNLRLVTSDQRISESGLVPVIT